MGREVRVKITTKLIEVFDQDLNSLAVHARLFGKENYSTDKRHYPEEKLALTQFSVQQAIKNSERVGPETIKLVSELLTGEYPLKFLRRVQGILRLCESGRVSRAGLEYACRMGMTYNKYQLTYIQGTAQYFDKHGNRPSIVRTAPLREASSMYLHNQNQQEEK